MKVESQPEISVILPVYNQANYLPRAVESILDQSLPNFELIVVDDGSTDGSAQALESFHDPRVRIVRQKNMGLSAARNTGLRLSCAPLVTFLDSDDRFHHEKLEVLSKFLRETPGVGLVAGRVSYMDKDGDALPGPEGEPCPLRLPELLFSNPICVSAVLMRRAWLDRVGFFDENLRACEDWDMWLRLLAAGCCMEWVEKPVVEYRMHQGQMTSQTARMRKAIFMVLDKFFAASEAHEYPKSWRQRAYASAFVQAACFAYLSGDMQKGRQDLCEAVQVDPSLTDDNYRELVDRLVAWAHDPRCTTPADFLTQVLNSLPSDQNILAVRLRHAIADSLLAPLFKCERGKWRLRKKDLLTAIVYKPAWLLNRGVLRMLAYAWLGF